MHTNCTSKNLQYNVIKAKCNNGNYNGKNKENTSGMLANLIQLNSKISPEMLDFLRCDTASQ